MAADLGQSLGRFSALQFLDWSVRPLVAPAAETSFRCLEKKISASVVPLEGLSAALVSAQPFAVPALESDQLFVALVSAEPVVEDRGWFLVVC